MCPTQLPVSPTVAAPSLRSNENIFIKAFYMANSTGQPVSLSYKLLQDKLRPIQI